MTNRILTITDLLSAHRERQEREIERLRRENEQLRQIRDRMVLTLEIGRPEEA